MWIGFAIDRALPPSRITVAVSYVMRAPMKFVRIAFGGEAYAFAGARGYYGSTTPDGQPGSRTPSWRARNRRKTLVIWHLRVDSSRANASVAVALRIRQTVTKTVKRISR